MHTVGKIGCGDFAAGIPNKAFDFGVAAVITADFKHQTAFNFYGACIIYAELCAMRIRTHKSAPAEQYAAAGRKELADNELAEEKVLSEYLPKMLSEEEVEARLKEIIAQVGASAPSDMGKVMGVATKALAGLADGKTISTIVRKLLS